MVIIIFFILLLYNSETKTSRAVRFLLPVLSALSFHLLQLLSPLYFLILLIFSTLQMHFKIHISTLLVSLLLLIPVLSSPSPISPVTKTIYQFSNPTWVENIAATHNGSLLVSLLAKTSGAELHLVNPFTSPTTATLIKAFPNSDSAFGITELSEDIFAIITGFSDLMKGPTVGSSSVWTVGLSPYGTGKEAAPIVKKIAKIKKAQFLNGAAALNSATILLADSYAGNVVALDTYTGQYSVVLSDASMSLNGSGPVPIGINGLKMHDGYLYYSNTVQGTLNRVKVNPVTGCAISKFECITSSLSTPDDFAIDTDGSTILAEVPDNRVVKVSVKGVVTPVAGNQNSSLVAGVTSVTLGRTRKDRGVVYVGTNGGLARPVNGTGVEGGKVMGIWL